MEFRNLSKSFDWESANLKSLEFIRDLAEERLRVSLQQNIDIQNRIFRYVAFLVPVASGLVYLLFRSAFFPDEKLSPLWLFFAALLVALLAILYHLSKMLMPHGIYLPGSKPGNIQIDDCIKNPNNSNYTKDQQYLRMVILRIESLDKQISHNQERNHDRTNRLGKIVRLVIWTLIVSSIVIIGILVWFEF